MIYNVSGGNKKLNPIVDSADFEPTEFSTNTDEFKNVFPYKLNTGLSDVPVTENDIPVWEIMIRDDNTLSYPTGIRPPKTENEKKAIDAIQYAIFYNGSVDLYATADLPNEYIQLKIVVMV